MRIGLPSSEKSPFRIRSVGTERVSVFEVVWFVPWKSAKKKACPGLIGPPAVPPYW